MPADEEDLPRISEAEWDVMNVIWDDPPRTALEVTHALEADRGWNHRTVKTLITRLVKKGVIEFEQDGTRYRYHPVLSRDECVRAESRSFLRRVAPDSVSPLLAHFVRESELSSDEIRELRRLLAEKEKAGRPRKGGRR